MDVERLKSLHPYIERILAGQVQGMNILLVPGTNEDGEQFMALQLRNGNETATYRLKDWFESVWILAQASKLTLASPLALRKISESFGG